MRARPLSIVYRLVQQNLFASVATLGVLFFCESTIVCNKKGYYIKKRPDFLNSFLQKMSLYYPWTWLIPLGPRPQRSEVVSCHVVRHSNVNGRRIQLRLHCLISHSREILNGIHVAVAYNVTNRKLSIVLKSPLSPCDYRTLLQRRLTTGIISIHRDPPRLAPIPIHAYRTL